MPYLFQVFLVGMSRPYAEEPVQGEDTQYNSKHERIFHKLGQVHFAEVDLVGRDNKIRGKGAQVEDETLG